MEAEKRTNRASIDSEVFELPLSSFVLEPDYADITIEVAIMSQPRNYQILIFISAFHHVSSYKALLLLGEPDQRLKSQQS